MEVRTVDGKIVLEVGVVEIYRRYLLFLLYENYFFFVGNGIFVF